MFRPHFNDPKDQQRWGLDSNIRRFQIGVQFGCETGLECRDPTSDPEVITRALSIPNEMFIGPQPRWILRAMMAGKLPDLVRLNPKRGRQSADIGARVLHFKDEMDQVLSDMLRNDRIRAVVDVPKMISDWEAYKSKSGHNAPTAMHHLFRSLWPAFIF